MKRKNTHINLIFSILILSFISGCTNLNEKNDVPISITGPYTKDKVMEMFDLDSIPLNINSKNLFFATVSNLGLDTIKIKSTNEHRIFPDSTWQHSYAPYSAIKPSWHIMLYDRDSNDLELIDIPREQSKTFWFSSYYDEYIDSLTFYFSGSRNGKIMTAAVNRLNEKRTKPNIKFQLLKPINLKTTIFKLDLIFEY